MYLFDKLSRQSTIHWNKCGHVSCVHTASSDKLQILAAFCSRNRWGCFQESSLFAAFSSHFKCYMGLHDAVVSKANMSPPPPYTSFLRLFHVLGRCVIWCGFEAETAKLRPPTGGSCCTATALHISRPGHRGIPLLCYKSGSLYGDYPQILRIAIVNITASTLQRRERIH